MCGKKYEYQRDSLVFWNSLILTSNIKKSYYNYSLNGLCTITRSYYDFMYTFNLNSCVIENVKEMNLVFGRLVVSKVKPIQYRESLFMKCKWMIPWSNTMRDIEDSLDGYDSVACRAGENSARISREK